MTIKEARVGMRVQLTAEAKKQFRKRSATSGFITGFGYEPDTIRVLRDRNRNLETWVAEFWEAVPSAAEILEATLAAFARGKEHVAV